MADKKREYIKFKEKERLPPLWKKDNAPQASAQVADNAESAESNSSLESSGSGTSRVYESGSGTSRTYDTSTFKSSEANERSSETDFSKIHLPEKWEENLTNALDRGEKVLKTRGQPRQIPRAEDAFKPLHERAGGEKKSVEKEINRISELCDSFDTIKNNPSMLRRFFSEADKCIKKGVELKVEGSKDLLNGINMLKDAYKEELSAARKAAVDEKRENFAKAKNIKSIELPKPGKK